MNIITEDLQLNQIIVSSKTQKLIEGDVIVPDVKPDILKLLQTDAIATVRDKHTSDGCVDITGKIDLTMLYIPDAEGERIKSINTSFDFDESILNKQILATDSVILNAYIERIEVNLINSRKLKVRAVVAIEYEVIRIAPLSIAVDAEECENVQIKRETVSVQNSLGVAQNCFDIHEKIEIPSGQESIVELLKYDIKITDCDYKPMGEKIIFKGTLCVCVLYIGKSGTIEFSEGEIPFTEIIEIENISENCCCDVDISVGECNVSLEEDDDGDIRIIDIEGSVSACVKVVEDVEVDMIADCYEPYKSTSVERQNVIIDEVVCRPQTQNTIRDVIEIDSNMPPINGVYDVLARPCVVSASLSGGKVACEGKIEAFVLYISDSEENPIYSIKKEIPFSYMMDGVSECDTVVPKVKAEIKHTGYSLNAAGEIELRIVLSLNANIIRQHSVNIVCEVNEDENEQKKSSGIVIYFVQKNDTLWDIAKKYCVPTQDIIDFNTLKDENLREGTRLLIPGR